MQFQAWLRGCEIGLCQPHNFQNSVELNRLLRLQVSSKQLHQVQTGSISSMQLDPVDHQYVISAGPLRTIHVHNTWSKSSDNWIPLVVSVDGNKKYQHKKAIHKIQWYPHDTGMFVSSSFDGTIKVWDTNQLKPVETMNIKHPIFDHHMSTAKHSLIAATASSQVRLADIRTGSTAHVLRGHRGNVLSLQWSPKDEHRLVSGSEDNTIKVWDVRQAKAVLRSLDQNNGLDDGGKSATEATAHHGNVNSLLFNEDGRYLISFGTDERMRMWNIDTGENTLVNYGRLENTSQHRPLYMSMKDGGVSSSVVFVPSGRHVLAINLFTGELLLKFSEHFSDVRCCEYNPCTQELFTCAQSSRVLIWSPDVATSYTKGFFKEDKEKLSSLLQDSWSDSD